MKNITEDTLIIGYDKAAGKDVAALSVCKCKGNTLFCIKTMVGKEAEDTYAHLTTFSHIDDQDNPQLRYLANPYDGDFNPNKLEKEKK